MPTPQYMMSTVTMDLLIQSPEMFLSDFVPNRCLTLPDTVSFSFGSIGTPGAQKVAYFGQSLTIPLFEDEYRVCLKQSYYSKDITDESGNECTVVITNTDSTQYRDLTLELNNQAWAAALLREVYAHCDTLIETQGLAVHLPRMQFVDMVLAFDVDASNTSRGCVYLVEPRIDSEQEGKFVKYINNNSPDPLIKEYDSDFNDRAIFLSFVQHAQYALTGGMVYTSDFQGIHI